MNKGLITSSAICLAANLAAAFMLSHGGPGFVVTALLVISAICAAIVLCMLIVSMPANISSSENSINSLRKDPGKKEEKDEYDDEYDNDKIREDIISHDAGEPISQDYGSDLDMFTETDDDVKRARGVMDETFKEMYNSSYLDAFQDE